MDELYDIPFAPQSLTDKFVFPLSFSQQRLWLLDQLEGASATYNIHDTKLIRGTLDIQALQQAIQAIVQRHEALRTTFDFVNDAPVQIITPEIAFSCPVINLKTYPEAERLDVARQYAQCESQESFNLQKDILLRVKLLHLSETEHVLLVTIHHIIADAWSMELLWQELSQLYPAFVQGEASPLPPLPIQYADYTLWQRERLQGERLETQLNYWKQKLDSAITVLPLPTDYARPPQQTFIGKKVWGSLSPELTKAIKSFSRQEGCTLFMTLLAAFQTLLFRYSGQDDITVGSPIAGRSQLETESLMGCFVNTLVLRNALSGCPSFRELLQRVRQTTLEAYEHQDLPFEKLVEVLDLARDRSRHPIFQVMLVLQNAPTAALDLPGLTSESLLVDNGTTKFDLTLSLRETPAGLEGTLIYSTDLFDAETITRLFHHFQVLLESAIAHPDQSIATLPLLTPTEQQQILEEWNNTTVEFPCSIHLHHRLHHLLEAQVERTPDAIAVMDEHQQLTYAAFNAKANQLAHYLQAKGIKPGTCVGLLVNRSVDMLIGLYGILKAGGAYVPLDPNYPFERIAFILSDAQVPLVVTQQNLKGSLAIPSICLDADGSAIASTPDTNLPTVTQPTVTQPTNPVAYTIYTSGSTGVPKGVKISHSSVVNLLYSIQQEPGLTAQDTVLAVTTLSFDIAVVDLYLPLMVGAKLVIASHNQTKDAHLLMQLMTRSQVTFMQATPATWQMLLEAGWQGQPQPQPQPQPQLKILCSGESLTDQLAQSLLERCTALWNLYGPTETTVWSTLCQIQPHTKVTIGRPIANTQIYILDRHLQPVPINVLGEIHIGGAGLAQGYHHRPQLTAEKFIPNPFYPLSSSSPLPRSHTPTLYKTGDLARYLPNGTIEYLGRLDHQVKIRGFRVELGEIATVLAQHPSVEAAIVLSSTALLREDEPGDQRLVAYVVFQSGMGSLTPEELRRSLQQKLPDYMIPAAYVPLDRFPLLPNGKIDRQAFPPPNSSHLARSTAFVLPQTAIEQQIAEIWQGVLKLSEIGIHDNFFDLGGHSLLATQVTSRIRQRFQVQLPLRLFFDKPTIAALATEIEQSSAQPKSQSAPTIKPVSREAWRRQSNP
jgi:amino acid adenylation domain-containing protein